MEIDENSTEWQVQGSTVFKLALTDGFFQGKRAMTNAFHIRVETRTSTGTTEADAVALAEKIAAFLRSTDH